MQVLVSVLILAYNHEKFIVQAIESVLEQKTNFHFEILVGNDCSTDRTGELIKLLAQKHPLIKELTPPHNIGALKNEKQLIEASAGKYICFLEGDDYWMDPLKLQKQVDFLEANPEFGLTHADVNHYYENTGKTELHVNRTNGTNVPEGYIFDALMTPHPFFIKTATVCFRKELVVNHFSYDLAIQENWPLTDFPLWLDITYHSKAHYFNEVFATYRLLNESASRTSSAEKKYKFSKSLYEIKQIYLQKYHADQKTKNDLSLNYHRILITNAFNLNDNALAKQAADFLKSRNYQLTFKEKSLLMAIRYPAMRFLLNTIR